MGRPIHKKFFDTTSSYGAITVTAWTTVAGSAQTGCDIVKQVGSRRYKITSPDGVGVCHLQAAPVTAVGQATMIATDSGTGTYYVTKLTAHKALLTQITGTQFANGTEVHWTLGTPVVDYSVQIENV
jgi:hypothetical protein